jgi:signal transduction histidine kinase
VYFNPSMGTHVNHPAEGSTLTAAGSAVPIGALETFVELLSTVEADGSSDAFYSSLCEAVCRLGSMDRAVIFRYDVAPGRVRAAGAYGLPLERFAAAHVTVDSAPVARQALLEDRVIEVDAATAARQLPASFHDLLAEATLFFVPISASGRWSGVILADRRDPRPLAEDERHVLWTLGKIAALATSARHATFEQARASGLQERIDLAREVHEGVIQRLFGVLLVVSSDVELSPEARARTADELQVALRDLRVALQRPLARRSRATGVPLRDELARLQSAHPELGLALAPGSEGTEVPAGLEPLAQSVLAEAVRNARKHASPTRVEVVLAERDGVWTMEITNDGAAPGAAPSASGMGLRLAAFEALQHGGLVEFGERGAGAWRVRLAVPLER